MAFSPRRWMPRIPDRIFLATKTGDPTATEAYDNIRRSIERLQVTRVDLGQLHSVSTFDDLDRRTASGGALEGALRTREEGLVAAIGITGHGMKAPAVHLDALRRFRFDTVLTPYNFRLTRYPEFLHDFEALVEEVLAQDAGSESAAISRRSPARLARCRPRRHPALRRESPRPR